MILNNTINNSYNLNENIHLEFILESGETYLTYYDDLYFTINIYYQGNYKIYKQKIINNKLIFDIKINENNILVDKELYYFDYNNLINQTIYSSNLSVEIKANYNDTTSTLYNNITITHINNTIKDSDYNTILNYNSTYIQHTDYYLKFIGYGNSSYTLSVQQYNVNNQFLGNLYNKVIISDYNNVDFKFIVNLKEYNLLLATNYLKVVLKDSGNNVLFTSNLNICSYLDFVNVVFLDDYYTYSNIYFLKYIDNINFTTNIVNIQDENIIINKKYISNYNINSEFIIDEDYLNIYNQLFNSNEIYYLELKETIDINNYKNQEILKIDRLSSLNSEFKIIKNRSNDIDLISYNFKSCLNYIV